VAVVTAPGRRLGRTARSRVAGQLRKAWRSRFLRPAKPVLANLASVPLTVAGLGCADFAAFHLAHGWGWLVTGASLMWLEHVIADET
jgi:hypothetical protein